MEKDGFQNQMVQFGYANQPNLNPFILVCLVGITQFEHYTLNKTVFKKCSSLIHSLDHRSLGQNTAIVNFLLSAKVYNFAVPMDSQGISCPLTQRNYYNKSIINSWHSTSMEMSHG